MSTAFLSMARTEPSSQVSFYGKLFCLFLIGLMLEGILRKWVLNDYQIYIGLIRDPIIIYTYFVYFSNQRNYNSTWIPYFIILTLLITLFTAINITITPASLTSVGFGYRYYLLYIPFAFIMGEKLSLQDIGAAIKLLLWCSIPVGLLVYVQFHSPPLSRINMGIEQGSYVFLVTADRVRPYGPFTFAQAQNTYAALMLAICLIGIHWRQRINLSSGLLIAGTIATFVMGVHSGGRTYFGSAILIAIFYALAVLTSKNSNNALRSATALFAGFIGFILVFIFVFPEAFSTMSERQATAIRAEGSTFDRAISLMTMIAEPLQTAPFFGYGIAAGSNANLTLQNAGANFILGEYSWPVIVNELGPLLGLIYIGMRIGLFGHLLAASIKANRRFGDPAALIMLGFAGYLLVLAQITQQNQLVSFCWAFVGMTLALIRLAKERNPLKSSPTLRSP